MSSGFKNKLRDPDTDPRDLAELRYDLRQARS
jgi:hypothetical protein